MDTSSDMPGQQNTSWAAAPCPTTGWPRPSDARTLTALALLVALAVAFAHWPVLDAKALTFDDGEYLTNNPLVQHPSWVSVRRFMTEVFAPSTVRGYYQPLTMISLMLDCAAGGGPGNLLPFHRTSLILHLANTILIVILLYRLLGNVWVAAMTGLLFGVHPMTVEPIAWVGDRKTTLAAFFALWSILWYTSYARGPRTLTYGLCIVCYVLALMSKPTTTLLPGAMLLLDFWPLRRLSVHSVLEKVPFGIIAAISAVITVTSQGNTAPVGLPTEGSTVPMLLGLCHNIIFYPCKMLWPVGLTSMYIKPDSMSLANPMLLAMVTGTVALAAVLLISLRWTRALLTGWLIFLSIVLPTAGGIGFTVVIASDKYAYLPAIGLLLVLAWLLDRLAGDPAKARPTWRPVGIGVGVLMVAGLLIIGTRQYLQEWETTERHEFYMLRLAPNSPCTHVGCGNALKDKGEHARSFFHYSKAIELKPDYALAYNNRGNASREMGNLSQAIHDYTKAIELQPDFAGAYYNRANAYNTRGDYREAISDHTKAIELRPDFMDAYNNRAIAHFYLKEYEKAWADVRVVKRLGGQPTPDLISALTEATGQTE